MTMEGTCVVISSSTASSEASRPRHDDDEEQHDEESCMSVSVKELQDLRNQVVQMRGDQKQRRGSSASSVSSLGEHSFRGNVPCTTTNKEDQMVLTTADKASSDRRKMFRLAILSNILFVLATCFYIGKSHSHLHWMRDSRDIPKSVLMADDDLTWRNYLTSQSQQKRQQETRKLRKRDDKMQKKDETNPQQMTDDFVEMTVDYNEYRWVDLPANIRHALIVLGHNERTWEAQANVPTDKLKWSELKKAQQNAAEVLGYTQVNKMTCIIEMVWMLNRNTSVLDTND